MSSSRFSSSGTSTCDALAGLGEGQLAELDAGAGHQVLAPVRRPRRQAQRVQAGDQLVELVVGHVEDDQLLVRREADAVASPRPRRGRRPCVRMVPDTRPAIGATPTAFSPFLSFCTPTWSIGWLDRLGRGAVDQLALQVLVLENLAELLDAPVLDQELQPRLRRAAGGSRSRGTTDDDGLPHVGHLVQRHPGADPLGQHRVGGQAAADPQVQAGAVLGVVDADERDVVDLVARRPAGPRSRS